MASLTDIQVVVLTPGEDSIAGGAGGAGAPGGSGSPVIHGDLGDDTITGGAANETILGGSGADQLNGGPGDDVLYGGLGDDFLVYDFDAGGSDRLFGGAGRDTLVLQFSSAYFSSSRQAEIAAYLALLSAGQDPGRGDEFAFETFGLRATSIENLLLFVDGAPADPNAPPRGVAQADSFSVSEDAATLTGDVSVNDGALDGDVFSLVDFDPENGALDLGADGSFVFTLGAQFQSLAVGETATVAFTYRLTTPGGSTVATATITVTGANDAPTANDAQAATDEDTPVTIDLLDLSGAADPDASDTPVLGALAGFALDIQARLVPLPSGAEAEGAAGGVVTFDPRGAYDFLSEGETAQETVAFVVSDGNGGLVTRNLTVTITGLNDAPAAANDSASAAEGGAVVVDLLANDFDPDANDAISLVEFDDTGSAGGVLFADEETGRIVFAANGEFDDLAAGETRATSFSYTIVDGFGALATATLTVTVTGENDAPTGGSLSGALTEDETLTGNFILDSGASDPDASDILRILAVDGAPLIGGAGVVTLASGATLTVTADGGFTYDPRAAFNALGPQGLADESFTVTVADGNGGQAEILASFAISGLNDAPVAVNDTASTTEDGFPTIDLLANDFDPDANDAISLVSFDQTGSAGGALAADGDLFFDPLNDFIDLAAGETRATTFSYTIVDGFGALATATLTVTVTGENDAPTGGSISGALTEDETLTGNFILDSGASDPPASDILRILAVDGAPLIGGAGVFTLASGAMLTVTADGGFTYDPRAAFNALGPQGLAGESFTVTLTDGNGGQADVFASLTISGLNDAPVAVNDSAATDQDSFVDITILQNDFDPDEADSIAIETFDEAGSAGGVLFFNEGGGLTFNPSGDFDDLGAGETRATTFSYTIADEFGAEATATITVTVTGLNDAPQGGFLSEALTEDETLTGNLILDGGVTDVDSTDVLTIIAVDGAPLVGGAGVFTLSTGATLTVSADGGFTYDPRAAFDVLTAQGVSGEFFTVTVSDGNGGEAEVFASLTILGVNDAPVAVADAVAGFSDRATFFEPLANDFDVDGPFDLVNFDVDGSAGGTIGNIEGSLRFDPGEDFLDLAPGATRVTTFTYTIEDDAGAQATATITVTVTGVAAGNNPPEGGSFTLGIGEDDAVSDDLFALSGAFDPDIGDSIRVIAVDGATLNPGGVLLANGLFLQVEESGAFTVDATGAFDALRDGEVVSEEFIVTIADNSGEEALITATIEITGVNDAPEVSPLEFFFSQNDPSGLLGLLGGATDAEGDSLSISFFAQVEGPDVFGNFGPAVVRYDGFTGLAGLEPTPLGDLNGDGFGDFFLGAGSYSGAEGSYIQGGRVILGGAANRANADVADGAYDGVVDLARPGLPGVLAIEGEPGTYALGFEVAGVGDLNGDGIDDILVSDAYFGDGGGAVHVVFGGAGGGAAFGPAFSPSRLDGANGFTIFGDGGSFGGTLSTQRLGDIDGDGIADFLVAAPYASPNGQSGAGSVFIVSGADLVSAAGGAASIGIGAAIASGGLRLNGAQAYYYDGEGVYLGGGRLGGALAAGDVDGDGIADILIGAQGEIAASGTGVTYLIFGDDPAALEAALGGTGGAATLTQASVAAAGGFALLNAGSFLSVIGDVNGDGFADIFVGARYTEGPPESYIVFGGRDSLGALDAQDGAADGRINLDRVQGEYGFVLSNPSGFGEYGLSVTAPGDVNGDGRADLLIGSNPFYGPASYELIGGAFLVFGGGLDELDAAGVQDGAITLEDVDGTTGYLFEARGDTNFGFAIASGDFDGDGAADLLISDARFRNDGGLRVGATYLISDAGAKLPTLDALDGEIDGRIDVNLLSGLFTETGEPPAGAFTPLFDDAEFDPSLFAFLGAGEQETVVIEYGVSDGTDETVNTVTITITGENDAPTGGDVSFETDEDTLDAPNIIAASGAFDVDANDILTVLLFDGVPLNGGTESFEFAEGAFLDVSADGTVVINGDFDFLRAGESLQFSFSFTVSDLLGETFTDNYSFTITGVNDAPVANDDAATTDQDTSVDVFVDENDDDADDAFSVVAIDAAGSAGGVLTERDLGGHVFDPNGEFDDLAEGETRETSFSYTIVDETGEEATATLTVTVTGLNDAPTGGDATFTTDEDTDLSGDFLAGANASDVDNDDALRLVAVNGQALTAGQVSVTFGSGAVLSANEDGTFSLSVAGNYESLAEGESASEAFSFTVADAAGASFTASATITIDGVNDAPVASSDAVETDEDTAIEIDLGANDSDIDDGTLIFGLPDTTGEFGFADIVLDYNGAGDPSQALGAGDGVFVSLPTGTSLTVAFIDEVIFDGAGADLFIGEIGPGGERANIEVSADGVNFTFIGVADNNTTTAFDLASIGFTEQLVAVRITGLDNGGSSPGFDVDFVQAVGVDVEGARGNLTDLGGGMVNYDPSGALDFLREGETFIDLFTYSVTDAFGAASVAVVEVTVTGVNDAPTGQDASFSTDEDTDLSGGLLAASAAADLDDGDTLRLTAINGQALTAGQVSITFGSGAVLTANEDGTFSLSVAGNYEALNAGDSASEAFSFTVADEAGASFTASATISISGVTDSSQAPVASNDSATVNEQSQISVAVLNNDSAPGGGPLTTSLVAGQTFVGAVAVLANQSIQFNPVGAYDFLGVGESATETIRYLATDSSNGLSDEGLFTVTITGLNDRPTGGSITDQTDEDTALTGNVIADSGAADRDANDVLRVLDVIIGGVRTGVTGTQSFTTASGATLTISEDGTYEYNPVGAFDALAAGETSAPDAFSVTLDDQTGTGLTTATLGSGATLTVQDNGEAQLGAAGFYDELDEGDTVEEVFSFTISDSAGASFTASGTFQIVGVNDPLIVSAATDPDPVPEGDVGVLSNVQFDLITFVTATDADEDDTPAVDPASISIVANAASDTADASSFGAGGGSVVVDTANFDFLAGGEFGIFDVTFDIVSGAERVTRTITITITGEDDGPVANDDAATTDEETAITVDVTANDVGIGESGPVIVAGQTFTGAVSEDAGQIVFDPRGAFDFLAVGETAEERIRYRVTNGETGLSDEAELVVTITGMNDAPVSESGGTPGLFVEPIDEDTPFTGNMIAGTNPILDADTNDALRVTVVDGRTVTPGGISFTGASGAAITVAENGDISIDPRGALDFLTGSDVTGEFFFYTVSDGNGGEIDGFVSLTILGVNDAPEVTAITVDVSELDDEFTIDLFEFARDAENDTLTISDFRQVSGLAAIAGQGLAGMRFEGDIDYGYAGDPAGLGDINGDGIDDFVFFRRGYSEGDNERGFIVFGESPAQETLDAADGALDAVANAGRIDSGTGLLLFSESNYGGRYLGAGPMGDVNGDGFAELLIADAYAGPNNGGAVFTIFGGKDAIDALGGTLDLSAVPAGAGFRLTLGAGVGGDAFGGVLPDAPVGDVDGDGVADLLIGSERVNRDDPIAHFVSGSALAGAADAAGNVDVNDLVRSVDGSAYRFVGGAGIGADGDSLRNVGLATGDIDGDGVDDFLISASVYDYYTYGAGETYVIFGGRDALAAADAADGGSDGDVTLDAIGAAGGFTLVGAAEEPTFIGDVNGDGVDDIALLDRRGFDVHVVFGGRDNLSALDDADGVRDGRLDPLLAAEEGLGFAFTGLTSGEGGVSAEIVRLGDIDGDGLADFAIANGSNRVEVTYDYAGEVHIVLTGSLDEADAANGSVDRDIDVDDLYTIRATPSTTTSDTGGSFADRIASADINGDGFLDLLIGESRFFDGSRFAGGAVHVLFGGGANRLREIDSGNDQFLLIGETLGAVTATGVPPAGALVFDEPVSFNPSAFGFLEAGEEEVLVFEFTVSDGQAETFNTLTITVSGDGPAVGGGFGQFLASASKPMVADETAFGLDDARSVEVPEPADARFFGSSGSDRIEGTEDGDVIRAGDGNDRVIAEEGPDLILGEGGDDDVRGGKGRDTIFGGEGDDTMFGQGGDDQIKGGRGEDVLNGGRGDDLLRGGRDEDTVIGGVGNDTLFGGDRNDVLNGGDGADRLNGGGGADRLVGSFGVDTFVFQRGFGNDRVLDFGLSETLDFSRHDGVTGLADLTITVRGADTLIEDGLGGRLVLVGIDSADLDGDNFLF